MPASTSYSDDILAFEREPIAFGRVVPRGGLVADGNIHMLHDGPHHRKRRRRTFLAPRVSQWPDLRLVRLLVSWARVLQLEQPAR